MAIPFPGRGHINPTLNLCEMLASKGDHILISVVVTEEWLGLLGSDAEKNTNFQFATIPNVLPLEIGRGADWLGFIEATFTKLEVPFMRLLDQLEPPPSVVVFDTYMPWVVGFGNRRNIPVASFWSMSASVLSVFPHFDLLVRNGHFPANLSERGNDIVTCIPGLPPTRISDLPGIYHGDGHKHLPRALEVISCASKAQYHLVASTYELEAHIIDALKLTFPVPLYSIGPAIPYFRLKEREKISADYVEWLDSQPKASVLYISQGSFLSIPGAQMEEIIAGMRESGVRFFWVGRGEASRIREGCGGKGLVVPWCDQLKVMCHPSVGGIWSHCGWNSTKEGIFAGLPFLTFPIFWDQFPSSKSIVEDYKIGWRVSRGVGGEEHVVKRDKIAALVKRFMDLGSEEGKLMRKRAKELGEECRRAISEGGSADTDIRAFLQQISG
ncbi:hypothetical protein NMG60_11014444 [Bertholletia excelsa]